MADSQELAILIRAQNLTQQAFEKARKDLASIGQESQKTNQFLGGLKTGLGSLGIAFGATAVISFAKDVLTTASNIKDLSSALGISTDAVQDFKLTAEQSGATIDDIGIAINKLNVEAGNNAKGFEKLGLSLEKIQAMSPEDRFRAVADALKDIEDPAVRAALGQELLGKGYRNLSAAIDDGIGSARESNKMSKETIDTLDALGDAAVTAGTKIKNFAGTVLAAAAKAPKNLWRQMNDDLERLGLSIEKVNANPTKTPVLFTPPGAAAIHTTTKELDDANKTLDAQRKVLDEASQKAKQHADAIAKLRDELSGKGAIQAARDMLEALKGTIPISKMTADAQANINKVVGEARDVYHAAGKDVPDDIRKVYEATFRLTDTIPLINRWKESLAHSADGLLVLKPIAEKLAHETWPATITGLERMVIEEGKLIQSTKTLGETLKGGLTDALTKIPELVRSAFTGGGGLGGAIQAIGSLIGSTIGKGIGASVKALGSLGGPLGEAIGALAGPLISGLGKLLGIGPTEYEKRMRAAAAETRNLQQQLVSAHGSMQQLIIDADLVGINIKEAFKWQDPEAFKKIVGEIDSKTKLLTAAMEEYGFTWEDLGDKARGAKLGQLFDELFAKTDILRTAGIDYHTILERQAGDYSKLVQAAIRTGTEIPIAMQPVLQDMIDLGLLTDENGEKLTDLTDIKWAKSMTEGFQDVTDAIHELTDALVHGVGGALDDIGKRVVHPRIEPIYGDSGSGEDASAAAAGGIVGPSRVIPFRHGGFVPRGTDTVPAMLTPGELVLNAAQQKRIASALSGADGDLYVTIDMGDLGKQMVKIARKDAARGGTRTRATSGRSY